MQPARAFVFRGIKYVYEVLALLLKKLEKNCLKLVRLLNLRYGALCLATSMARKWMIQWAQARSPRYARNDGEGEADSLGACEIKIPA